MQSSFYLLSSTLSYSPPDDALSLLAFKSPATIDPSNLLSTWSRSTNHWLRNSCFRQRISSPPYLASITLCEACFERDRDVSPVKLLLDWRFGRSLLLISLKRPSWEILDGEELHYCQIEALFALRMRILLGSRWRMNMRSLFFFLGIGDSRSGFWLLRSGLSPYDSISSQAMDFALQF